VPDVHAVEDRAIDTEAGSIGVRIYRPSAAPGLPVVVFFHGGGWVLCDLDSHDGMCRQVANSADAVVVAIDYRRAPESRYPAAVEDCYAATLWVAAHGDELGVDTGRMAVMGDSAGGNLAAAVTLLARDRSGPSLALQVLLYPVIADDFETASYRSYGADYSLTTESMQWFWDQYVDPDRRHEPYVAPIRSTDLSGVPAAIVLVAECDPLHDEGLAYARALAAAGVPTETLDWVGGFHGFLSLSPLLDGARAAETEVLALVRSSLHR
jgi:acetyl esterase